jgi:hypothetical protein
VGVDDGAKDFRGLIQKPHFAAKIGILQPNPKKIQIFISRKRLIQLSSNFAGIFVAPLRPFVGGPKLKKIQTNMAVGSHLGF